MDILAALACGAGYMFLSVTSAFFLSDFRADPNKCNMAPTLRRKGVARASQPTKGILANTSITISPVNREMKKLSEREGFIKLYSFLPTQRHPKTGPAKTRIVRKQLYTIPKGIPTNVNILMSMIKGETMRKRSPLPIVFKYDPDEIADNIFLFCFGKKK